MTQSADAFISLLIEIAKIIASGLIGGFLGSKIALRQFQSQTRFQAKHHRNLEQIDALQEILVILPVIFRDICLKWELPSDGPINSKQHIAKLTAQLIRTRSLFLDDPETISILDSIKSLVGETYESFLASGQEMPGAKIEKIKRSVEEKIKEIGAKAY